MGESIPFKVTGLKSGLAEAQGLLHLADDVLVLEFETKDTVIGATLSRVHEIRVSLSDIESIENRKKIFGSKLRLKAFKMKTFDGFPGHKQGQIELEFSRREKEAAQDLSKLINHKLKMLSV